MKIYEHTFLIKIACAGTRARIAGRRAYRRFVLRRCPGCPRKINTGHKMDCAER